MTPRRQPILGILVALLLAGCSPSATGSPTPTSTATPASFPTASTAVLPSPTSTMPSPSPSPSAAATPDTSIADATWTGIAWRMLPADDPLAQIRWVTRWRGGYIARGDPMKTDPSATSARVPLWTSTDSRSWDPLGADALGSSTIVVGMAATGDGLVALTLEAGPIIQDEDAGDMVKMAGPLRSWTSSTGTTWADHPGPAVDHLSDGYVRADGLDWLESSTAPLLIVTAGSRPPFVSTDGVVWARETTSGLPAAFRPNTIKPIGSGFVAVGDTAIASSPDGRIWTTRALPAGCSVNEGLVMGRAGFIATGLTDGDGTGVQPWVWCASVDLHTWRKLAGLSPLGRMSGSAAQECQDNCPDGTLVGDGQRMIAYRGWGDQVGWTSFDGRTWQPLAFDGRPERSSYWLDDRCTGSLVLWPMGVGCTATDGTIWFGEARS